MKLAILTTVLSLISVVSCAETTGNVVSPLQPSEPQKPSVYITKTEDPEGKSKSSSRLTIGPKDVKAQKLETKFFGVDKKTFISTINSVHVHNSEGIDLGSVSGIASNLDTGFVKAAVTKEEEKRQEKITEK